MDICSIIIDLVHKPWHVSKHRYDSCSENYDTSYYDDSIVSSEDITFYDNTAGENKDIGSVFIRVEVSSEILIEFTGYGGGFERTLKFDVLTSSNSIRYDMENAFRSAWEYFLNKKDDDTESDDDDWEYDDDDEEECLTFVDNADELVRELLCQKSTKAFYKGLLDSMNNSRETFFATSFQNYVTRLGLIVHEVASKKFSGAKTKHCNYVEVLRYICKDILEDDSLYKKLEKLNKPANDAKHSTKNVRIDINKFVTYFNDMIDNLVSVSGCKAFGICHLYVRQNKNIERKIICHCCGLVNLAQYHQCPECKKYVCVDCFDRKRRMCAECKAAAAPKKRTRRAASSEAGGEVAGMVLIRGAGAVSDFYLCDHAVTQAEYERIMGKNPSVCVGEKLPVTKVTLYDAIEYCNQLSKQEGLRPFYRLKGLEISYSKTSDGYRLPTDAEWLFAAADLKDCDSLEEYAWFKQAGSRSEPREVCLKKQNDKGLYDLLGNVSEWCYDFKAKKTFDYGGSFNQKEELIRQMANGNKNPLLSYDRVGFRVARNAE